jgi:hypothetical protein
MKRKYAVPFLLLASLLLTTVVLPTSFAQRKGPVRAGAEAPRKTKKASKEEKAARAKLEAEAKASAAALSLGRPRQAEPPVPVSVQAADFAITPPLKDISVNATGNRSMRRSQSEVDEERPEKVTSPPPSGYVDPRDGALAPAGGKGGAEAQGVSLNIPATTVNFEGLSSDNNAAILGFRVMPPDTVGDVGPNHYVQATNLLFRVFNKSGTPLTAPMPVSALFTALGPPCSNTDDGDPIVLYDSFADRWIITQFMVSGAAPLSQCFAVSRTPDPTGSYFAYRFVMPNMKFNDYPKFGVWPDGYYWSNNQFNLAGTAFEGVGVFALDRAKLLAGDPTASFIFFDLQTAVPNARSMLPSDADGLLPPPPGAPNVFAYFNANEFLGDLGDSLRLFNFHADFATPANSTFTERADSPLPVAAFSPLNPAGLDDIEQPPPSTATTALDSISDRLLHRLQYRNYGAHEALTVNHTVNVGTGTTLATHQAGVRYYELRRTLPGGNWTVREQATFAPDTDNRWMGSSALDHEGNLAVGYTVSSTTTFPSIRYAGRLAGDPLGGLAQGEATLIAGSGVQTSTLSRWGDYSSLNVDPTDDCTFWHTNEYYTAASQATSSFGWVTRVGSFKVNPTCQAPAQGRLVVNVTDCDSGLPIQGASVTIDSNLYGSTLADGSFGSQLAPGTYNVSVSAPPGYPLPASTAAVVNNGQTTTVNLCLMPAPLPAAAGVTLTSESCPPNNGAVDPAERVSVDLKVMNNGSAATTNLVATLQPSANVIAPSGPQNYGAIPVGGMAARNFSFTANGNCGDNITLTLQLQDGATNLGTVNYTVRLGSQATALVENFDGVTAPALPAGWTTTTTGIGIPWTTSTLGSDTAPNNAFGPETANVGVTNLTTPNIPVSSSSAQLTFRNRFNLEQNFDGMVLEISIGGGAFQDILAAGGSFVTGGYNGTLSTGFGNPLPGRQAWTGLSGGTTAAPTYITSTVNLPAAAAGQNIQLRWRVGSDNSLVAAGQNGARIDTIRITDGFNCVTSCALVRLATSATLTRVGSDVVAAVTVQNQGVQTANNVMLTQATLGAVTGAPLPQALGNIAPGASATTNVTFANPGAPGASVLLRLGGTHAGGTFSSTRRVTLP